MASFDRRENDFLHQEIRTFRVLDEFDFFVDINESEPVGFEKNSINDNPEPDSIDFSQIFNGFDFLSILIDSFGTF